MFPGRTGISHHPPMRMGSEDVEKPLIHLKGRHSVRKYLRPIIKCAVAAVIVSAVLCSVLLVSLGRPSLSGFHKVFFEKDSRDPAVIKYARLLNVGMDKNATSMVADFEAAMFINSRIFLPVHVKSKELNILLVDLGEDKKYYTLSSVSIDTTIPITSKNTRIMLPFQLQSINKPALKIFLGDIASLYVKYINSNYRIIARGTVEVTVAGILKTIYKVSLDISDDIFPANRTFDSVCMEYQLVLDAKHDTRNLHAGILLEDYTLEYELRIPNPSIVQIEDPNIAVRAYVFKSLDDDKGLLGVEYRTGANSLAQSCNILRTDSSESQTSLEIFNVLTSEIAEIVNSGEDNFDFIIKDLVVSHKKNTEVNVWMSDLFEPFLVHAKAKVRKPSPDANHNVLLHLKKKQLLS